MHMVRERWGIAGDHAAGKINKVNNHIDLRPKKTGKSYLVSSQIKQNYRSSLKIDVPD